ncbi:MAG: HDOD domain-containing protein [Candidatus Nitricoxidivorans perseverans]|uniref:HDOD domain-containing protein n=1 Tax=Candidatus Nitricoxidivorans perseverans TaxID=2975601 RepID=A0AA49IY63_9PROT|nr:MAG: HDOD domain-containing protein [Candidatus Nitricoxidivorans perseverans]
MTDTVGRFEIRRELGRGAQSAVYLAWDPQLQREVAIKTLHFTCADPERNAVLLDEARMVSKLRHANVVPIFDAGEQDGDPYLVFEYVEGRNLLDVLAEDGPMPPARAADIMRQVADALAQAHALGIIHRDLKPSNIILDRQGVPRVMDFGIASRVPEAGREDGRDLVGTPSYMAPEYVTRRVVGEKADVFAAGLVLLEMLTGKRVFQGGGAEAVLRRVAHEAVALPRDAGIDDRLGDIILKACAPDPAMRLPTAAQMRQALEGYLGASLAPPAANEGGEAGPQGTLEFLLRRMRHKSDFPALSESVSAINKMTNSDRESINKLSNTILRDYALTNKILRLVNSAYYRQAGGGNISTVSRAVIVLGFDTIRSIAITVLLFEHLQDKANARELKEAFLRANLAGLLGRDASRKFAARESEEAFICALFHGLGQLLARYYFPEEEEEIRKIMQQKHVSEEAAASRVLGISFEDLGIGVARTWGFPALIVNSMRRLPEGKVRKPVTHEEALHVVAGFSNELCDRIAGSAPEDRAQVVQAVMERFSVSMQITDRQLQATLDKSLDELTQVASILRVNLKQSAFARQARAFAGGREEAKAAADDDEAVTLANTLGGTAMLGGGDEAAAAVPENAQNVLAAGIQDISNSLVEDFSLNDLLRIILETMYRAMGFQRVLLCLKDGKSQQMTGRFGFGPDTGEVAKRFRFPLAHSADVFHLAVAKGVDIIIADIDDPKIAGRIPDWYRRQVAAKTFVLFPLNLKGNPVAMIYCDKEKAGSIAIPENELTLLKTLRNQALLAIKQSV